MRLKDFKERYVRSTKNPEEAVLNSVANMTSALNKFINASFLRDVDEYKATQSMSLVFEMAPGYRELYKYFLMMHGDPTFEIPDGDNMMSFSERM
ncbi:DUF2357 domain-containing protein [uncultured Fibrobacter sp.]|uniref:DUF2357 domain-containing protein n=1 Tax=uncultured Fibrobacter sp. TaxID=261512 RepID=UPI0034597C60